MRYDLRAMARRAQPGLRRKSITLRDIAPPATFASDLYAASYRPIVTLWRGRIPAIIAAYEQTLSTMTTDSPADVQIEIEAGEGAFSRIFLELTAGLRRWALRTEAWQRGKWRGAVLSATGVDVGTLIGAEDVRDTIENTIARNVGLIKDVSQQAQGRITDAVFRGLNQRLPAREVAREIRQAVDMSQRRAMGIASHQLSDISNRLADERRREAGLDTWMWIHSAKKHPRAKHLARNGKEYTDETAPADRPGSLPFCGCRSRAVLVFD